MKFLILTLLFFLSFSTFASENFTNSNQNGEFYSSISEANAPSIASAATAAASLNPPVTPSDPINTSSSNQDAFTHTKTYHQYAIQRTDTNVAIYTWVVAEVNCKDGFYFDDSVHSCVAGTPPPQCSVEDDSIFQWVDFLVIGSDTVCKSGCSYSATTTDGPINTWDNSGDANYKYTYNPTGEACSNNPTTPEEPEPATPEPDGNESPFDPTPCPAGYTKAPNGECYGSPTESDPDEPDNNQKCPKGYTLFNSICIYTGEENPGDSNNNGGGTDGGGTDGGGTDGGGTDGGGTDGGGTDGGGVGGGTGDGTDSTGGDGDCDSSSEDCAGEGGMDNVDDQYEPKEDTFESVTQDFITRMNSSPIITSSQGFFTVSIGGSCPTWVLPSVMGMNSFVIDAQCSSAMQSIWPLISAVIIATCGFIGFRWAFL